MRKVSVLLTAFFCLSSIITRSQTVSNVKATVADLNNLREKLPVEKLYLQTDKPYYTLGDTLHFKSYLLNADYLTPSARSGLLYVELDNTANKPAKQIMVPVTAGLSWADIPLDEKEIPQGYYTLRAYTNWMRNFGENYIFKKTIYISPVNNTSTLVTANFKPVNEPGKNTISAELQFTGLDKTPLRLKDMQLYVTDGRHKLFKYKAGTGMDGILKLSFDLNDKADINSLVIQAQQVGKGVD